MLTFTEPVMVGPGNLTPKNLTATTQSIIPITDTTRVTVAGSVLTVNPTANLASANAYAIQIDTTTIDDTAGNSFAGITNDRTWNFTVSAPPTLASSAIVDDKNGSPVPVNTLVTYTVTFNRDLDASTVSAIDFGNAGTAAASIGTITETAPGVFSVPVTPTSAGTLQLRVNAAAVLNNLAGSALNTNSPILDDTPITVQTRDAAWSGGATFDADANGDGVNNGTACLLDSENSSTNTINKLPVANRNGGNLSASDPWGPVPWRRCLMWTAPSTA